LRYSLSVEMVLHSHFELRKIVDPNGMLKCLQRSMVLGDKEAICRKMR